MLVVYVLALNLLSNSKDKGDILMPMEFLEISNVLNHFNALLCEKLPPGSNSLTQAKELIRSNKNLAKEYAFLTANKEVLKKNWKYLDRNTFHSLAVKILFEQEKSLIRKNWQKGLEKAKHIGKGINQADKNGRVRLTVREKYYPEALIDGHPRNELFKKTIKSWKNDKKNTQSLDEYFETQNYDLTKTYYQGITGGVEYLSKKDLNSIRIKFHNGALIRNGKILKPLQNQDYSTERLFAISTKGVLFCLDTSTHYHTSILSSESVLCSGELEVNNQGKIVSIDNGSGHYQPGEIHLVNALISLVKSGADLTHLKNITVMEDGFTESYKGLGHYCKSIKSLYFPDDATDIQILRVLKFFSDHGNDISKMEIGKKGKYLNASKYFLNLTTLDNIKDKSELKSILNFLKDHKFNFSKITHLTNYSKGNLTFLLKFLKKRTDINELTITIR